MVAPVRCTNAPLPHSVSTRVPHTTTPTLLPLRPLTTQSLTPSTGPSHTTAPHTVSAGSTPARVIDYPSTLASPTPVLEGTGVLVLDRIYRVAYVALSERADEKLAR